VPSGSVVRGLNGCCFAGSPGTGQKNMGHADFSRKTAVDLNNFKLYSDVMIAEPDPTRQIEASLQIHPITAKYKKTEKEFEYGRRKSAVAGFNGGNSS